MKGSPYRLRYMLLLAVVSFAIPLAWAAARYEPAPAESWTPAGGPQAPARHMVVLPDESGGNWLVVGFEGEGVWKLPAGQPAKARWSRLREKLSGTLFDGLTTAALVPLADGRLLALLADGAIWVLTDISGGWRPAASPVYPPHAGVLSAGARGAVYFVLHTLLYHSDDAGQSWAKLSLPPQIADVVCLLADGPAPGMLTIGTHAGELFVTADEGASWQTLGTLGQGAVCRALARDGQGGLYAATSAGLYHWQAENGRWMMDAIDFAGQDVAAVLIADSRPAMRFTALRHGGVWRWRAGDGEWEPVGRGLEHLELKALALDEMTGGLYAGTSRGVWRMLIALPPAEPTAKPAQPSVGPTPSPTCTASPTFTRTPSPLPTATIIRPTTTHSPTAIPTLTPSPSPTSTPSPTYTRRPTATSTPTDTPAPVPTNTPARPVPATPTPSR